jgi:predicted porin
MKPNKLLAAAGLAGLAATCAAQTSVTIYGTVDAGFAYSTNRGTQTKSYVRSGNLSPSLIGLRGSEDLGGQRKALFMLESGYEADTGMQSESDTLFNRQAYVGLYDPALGAVKIGRQYTPYYQALGPIGPTPGLSGATGAHPGDNDGLYTTISLKNALGYESPQWAGLQLSLMGASGEANASPAGSANSAGLSYTSGPWRLGVGYLRMLNADQPAGWSTDASGRFTESAVNAGYLTASSIRHVGAGVEYAYSDHLSLGANATQVRYKPGNASIFRDNAILNNYGLFGVWHAPQGWDLGAGYSFTKATKSNGIEDPAEYHQVSLSQVYNFSKRTSLYLLEAWQKADGNTLNAAGLPVGAVAVVGNSQAESPSSTQHQSVFMIGLRHMF